MTESSVQHGEPAAIIRYKNSIRGVRYYDVIADGDDVFTGTLGECKRFISIHNEKVLLRQEMERASKAG
ncbi:MAG: hypothetical protein R3F20_04210 [Planctomycetota bacterium]